MMNLRSRKPKTTESDGILTKSLTHTDRPNQIGNEINQKGSKNNINIIPNRSIITWSSDRKERRKAR